MDEQRFDSLTRRLAARLSRRGAFRLGAATALGAMAFADIDAIVAQDPETTANDRFISLFFFPYDGDFDDAKTALKPLLRLMQQQPGFITLSFIEDEAQLHIVTTFLDKTTSDAGTAVLEDWIANSDQTVLSSTPTRDSGEVFLRSELGAGCWCSIDDDDACGTGDLICCATVDSDRGICLPSATICPTGEDDEDDTDEDDDTETDPTPTSVAAAACTSEGCACTVGVDNFCDGGLLCCGDEQSGVGTCLYSCPCGSEGCDCIASVINTCDDGLICCAPGEIGGAGTCQYGCSCTSEGCACTTGVDGTCDDGLFCCGIGSTAPGSIGACLTACATDSYCPGSDGCECGQVWQCNEGLVCCGATIGDTGICMSEDEC